MSHFKPESDPQQALPSESNTKPEDETQKDFQHNNKKLLISKARIIENNQGNEIEMKLPQKTQENIEEIGVIVGINNNDASMARDEKVMQAEQNEYYIFFNRFLYSKKCLIIYILILITDLVGIANLISSYFVKISNNIIVNFKTAIIPVILIYILIVICIVIEMIAKYYISVNKI